MAPGTKLLITFISAQNTGELRVSLADGSDVSVRTVGGASTFTSSDGRLIVSNTGGEASFDIEVPRSAPRVELRVAGQLRYLKNGQRISSASATRRGALYVIPLQRFPPDER